MFQHTNMLLVRTQPNWKISSFSKLELQNTPYHHPGWSQKYPKMEILMLQWMETHWEKKMEYITFVWRMIGGALRGLKLR